MGTFTADIRRFCERAGANADTVVRKVVIDLGTAIIERTPVGDPLTWKHPAPAGYVGGRARGSWTYGFGTVPPGANQVDGSGAASMARITSGVGSHDARGVHYIINSVPYMRRLEFEGWSTQAPAGMVRITIEEFQQFVADACREVNP